MGLIRFWQFPKPVKKLLKDYERLMLHLRIFMINGLDITYQDIRPYLSRVYPFSRRQH